jgi:hypothetical protein
MLATSHAQAQDLRMASAKHAPSWGMQAKEPGPTPA